jgi:type II secretory pathway component PulF
MLNVVVLPKFKEVFWSMANGESLPQFTTFVLNYNFIILLFQSMVMLLVWLALVAYVGGPRFTGWMRTAFPGVPDRIFFLLPWRRKRLQRDFSSMLAILLDSGVPEADAVALAAESTTNRVLHHRAADVCGNLSRGMKLPEAIRAMDDSGELRWRLTNALQHGRDFVRALAGWHEALDAKAFQQEQAAAQFTTTALVLFNGVIVASIVAAVFLALTNLMMEVALW